MNSAIERHYFEQFRRAYVLPEGTIEYGDKPDVLLRGGRTTGIEIRNFYLEPGESPGSEQRQRGLREGVTADAHKLYRAKGGRGIELTVGFDRTNPITLSRRQSLPAMFAEFARRVDSRESGEVERSLFQDAMPEFSFVYLNAKEYVDAQWRIAQTYGVDNMSMDKLEAIIKEKESKAADYRACDAYWLLIVVDWIDPAQEQEIRIDQLKVRSDVFEKIIIYKPNFEHIVELTS